MPVLRNQRHERFAQELAAGKTADEAYQVAGYRPNRCNASRLKTRENISSRVAEIQDRAAVRVEVDRAWVLSKLIENANRALQAQAVTDKDGQPVGEYRYDGSVANRALELIGKELSMFIDRKEVGVPGEFKAIEVMNVDELRRLLRTQAEALGLRDVLAALEGGGGSPRGQLN